ncbi:hypothetical protein KVQ90_23855, partial [Escherichia coli]|nr:hypothetical protein [Escherichia coli]
MGLSGAAARTAKDARDAAALPAAPRKELRAPASPLLGSAATAVAEEEETSAGGQREGREGSVAGGGGEEDVRVGFVALVVEDGAEEGAAGEVALPQDAPPVRRLVPLARVESWLRLHRR